jgi:hypothetical protein
VGFELTRHAAGDQSASGEKALLFAMAERAELAWMEPLSRIASDPADDSAGRRTTSLGGT